jgi:hypothetical protein
VSVAVVPGQITGELTVIKGIGLTVTVDTAVPVQPEVVPVTVYEVVVVGAASAVATPVEVAPADHVYDVAPLAVIVAVAPLQIVGDVTVTVGNGVTVTVETAVPEHPPVVPVTV